MRNNSAAIFIPARLNSSRFPKKILEPIGNKPLIVHVLERAQKSNLCDCYVACDSEEVKELIESYGGNAILTDPDLPSGSDRIFAALETLENKPEYVINLQGDTPVFDELILPEILNVLQSDSKIDMTTPVNLHETITKFDNRNLVKVVFCNMNECRPGRALYFSRSPIPNGTNKFYSHIGIYAYRYDALKAFVNSPQSFLEKTESLEQLRALELGLNVWAVPVKGKALSVDVRDDLEAVNKALGI